MPHRVLKRGEWDGKRMVIDTGHKTFDRQTNLICEGNVIANTMLGWQIRPRMEIGDWSEAAQRPGHLRAWDLERFRRLPRPVKRLVEELTEGWQGVWLYEFSHRLKPGYWQEWKRIVHGYVITTNDHLLLARVYCGPTYKSLDVIDTVTPYVSAPGRQYLYARQDHYGWFSFLARYSETGELESGRAA